VRSVAWRACPVVVAALLLGGIPARAQTEDPPIPLHGQTDESLQEVARGVRNPISTLWQMTLDHEIVGVNGGDFEHAEPAYTGSFQPTMPVNLSRFGLERFDWARDFNVITRAIVPFAVTQPLEPGDGDRRSGFGDIELASAVAPNRSSGWVWGIGPTFIFPSASDDALGQGKWQAGPVGIGGYLTKDWNAYVVAQQWWSFAGNRDRARASQLDLNYVLIRNLPGAWQVGMQPSMTVDWTASSGNKVSFPVGLGVGRTVLLGKIPVQFYIEADYFAVRPDDFPGPRWSIDVQIIPVISELYSELPSDLLASSPRRSPAI
jgi:hypothetical protein